MHRFCLAEIFSDGMVLQRNEKIRIFGDAPQGDKIRVSLRDTHGNLLDESWGVADENNRFEVRLMPLEASWNDLLAIRNESSGQLLRVENISIGEVWLAGGQSNMEFFNKYEKNWDTTKKLPMNKYIHFYNVPQRAFEGHDTHNGEGRDGYGRWLDDKEEGYENFSAIGYTFARTIQEKLKVPVGIIGCNWGGTTASAWVPESVLDTPELRRYLTEYETEVEKYSEEELRELSLKAWKAVDDPKGYHDFEKFLYGRDRQVQLEELEARKDNPPEMVPMGPYNENRPCGLYETMLKTVIPYSIKGALWYQGESDAGDRAPMYDSLLKGLINSWRDAWNLDLSFLIVQLAPFKEWLDCTNDGYKIVREKQRLVAETMENVYMTAIGDLGEEYDIHPKEKVEIGNRLAGLALCHVYEKVDSRDVENPCISKVTVNSGNIVLEFENAKDLSAKDELDEILIHAKSDDIAVHTYGFEGNKILIKRPDELTEGAVISISIGVDDYGQISIKNENGLPIVPFKMEVVHA